MTQGSESGERRELLSRQAKYEYDERREEERAKAKVKYSDLALRLSGHPDYDVLDYAINELVGLWRYGEMIGARVAELAKAADSDRQSSFVACHNHAQGIEHRMKQASIEIGCDLIRLRNELKALGVELGKPELTSDSGRQRAK